MSRPTLGGEEWKKGFGASRTFAICCRRRSSLKETGGNGKRAHQEPETERETELEKWRWAAEAGASLPVPLRLRLTRRATCVRFRGRGDWVSRVPCSPNRASQSIHSPTVLFSFSFRMPIAWSVRAGLGAESRPEPNQADGRSSVCLGSTGFNCIPSIARSSCTCSTSRCAR